jgi:hypothetical protein
VSRSRPMSLNGLAILVAAGMLCLLTAERPARAAGCHVPDRPVLGTKSAWEQEPGLELGSTTTPVAPPVLTHPPCSGEVPHAPNASSATLEAACVGLVAADLDAAGRPEALRARDELGDLEPRAFRLDRPPRAIRSLVRIDRPA